MSNYEDIEQQATALAAEGADPLRVNALRQAAYFKRAWIEMADALLQVREKQAFKKWGHEDFYQYCNKELHLRQSTVDKLMVSYGVVRTYAPSVLEKRDEPAHAPELDAVNYFSKAVTRNVVDDQDKKSVVDELRKAVFEEGRSVGTLRKQFEPAFEPSLLKNATDNKQRAAQLAKALDAILSNIRGVSGECVATTKAALSRLQHELQMQRENTAVRVPIAAAKKKISSKR